MSSIQDQINAFENLLNRIETELPVVAKQIIATDMIALVTNRVVQKGENSKGQPFSAYSDKEVGAFRFVGKSRNNSADARVRALARAKGLLSYKDFRELNNLKTDKKNFEFTGDMFRKFGIVGESRSGDKFTISVGGTTPDAQQKIDDNSEREGISIIDANDKELDFLQNELVDWLTGTANDILT